MKTTPQSILRDHEQAVSRIILQCIRELPFPFGIRRTIGVLKGSHSQYILRHELYQGSMFGIFAAWQTSTLEKIIERLIEYDLLRVELVSTFENLPTLALTATGDQFLDGYLDLPFGFSAEYLREQFHSFLEDMDLDQEDGCLYEELRQLRNEIARGKQLPPYTICYNKVLRQLARKRPLTADELYPIPGIGDRFVEQYGDQFTSVIGAFSPEIPTKSPDEQDSAPNAYQQRLRKIKAKHPRAYESWCDDEDDRLRQMVGEGQSVNEIAEFLQRQDGAIRSRVKKLGLA
jgi:ATP-dependent DNA helicase RecQ